LEIAQEDKFFLLILTAIIAVISGFFARKWGFFAPSKEVTNPLPNLTFPKMLFIIFGYVFIQITVGLIVVFFVKLIYYVWLGTSITKELSSWVDVFSVFLTVPLLFKFFRLLDPAYYNAIVNADKNKNLKNFSFGVASAFIAIPLAQMTVLGINLFLSTFYTIPDVDQEAVRIFKGTFQNPYLFSLMFINISIFIPCLEELVARGALQTWLRQKLGVLGGILVASFIFAAVHFSWSQDVRNIELLASIFVMSLFLGYIFERQKSLWAPIGLHVTMNTLNLCFLTYELLTEG
jgi:membrane protease YdiL (CAAX protease family)